jgi:hypothetical protein
VLGRDFFIIWIMGSGFSRKRDARELSCRCWCGCVSGGRTEAKVRVLILFRFSAMVGFVRALL